MKTAIKIIGHLFVILVSSLYPALFELTRIIKAFRTGFYRNGDEYYYPEYPVDNLKEILELAYPRFTYMAIISICISALVLISFAIYKENKYEKGIILTFFQKVVYLALPLYIPFSFLLLYFFAAPRIILAYFILTPITYSLFLNILLFLFVDFWIEKKLK